MHSGSCESNNVMQVFGGLAGLEGAISFYFWKVIILCFRLAVWISGPSRIWNDEIQVKLAFQC